MTGYVYEGNRVRMSVFSGEKVTGINGAAVTPELCAMLGSAAGTVQGGGRVGVGCSGTVAACAMKRAFIAGAQSAGALVMDFGEVMESEAVFGISALGLQLSAYITGGNRCSIKFLGVGGSPAAEGVLRRLDETVAAGDFRRCCWNEYLDVADTGGIKLLYRRELYSAAPLGLSGMSARAVCENRHGENLFRDTLQRLGCSTDGGNIFRLSGDGMSLTIEDETAGIIGPNRVGVIYCGTEFEQHNDVAVPFDAPVELESLAERYGRRIYRVGALPQVPDGGYNIARAQYRMRDGIMTAVRLMAYMRQNNISIEELDLMF